MLFFSREPPCLNVSVVLFCINSDSTHKKTTETPKARRFTERALTNIKFEYGYQRSEK
jgi:hypothetical protein